MATGRDSIFVWVVRFTLSQWKCSVKKMVGWSPEAAFLCGGAPPLLLLSWHSCDGIGAKATSDQQCFKSYMNLPFMMVWLLWIHKVLWAAKMTHSALESPH